MSKDFGISERRILSLFTPGAVFDYFGKRCTVVLSGKPTCYKGEPKTDIYVLAECGNRSIELKISFKQNDADFLENKMNAERAEQLFGSNWSRIISSATRRCKNAFLERPLIYKTRYRRTEEGSITLGWKFELLNVKSGDLSGEIPLTQEQIIDVYAGTNLSADKRNACVNGEIIPGSGIANCILFEDDMFDDIQDAVNNLIPIEEYAKDNPKVYFACKALNYRCFAGKYDGNRPLSVYVDWSAANGKLTPELIFNHPLERGGNYVCERLLRAMHELGIKTTDDISSDNVLDPGIIHF